MTVSHSSLNDIKIKYFISGLCSGRGKVLEQLDGLSWRNDVYTTVKLLYRTFLFITASSLQRSECFVPTKFLKTNLIISSLQRSSIQ